MLGPIAPPMFSPEHAETVRKHREEPSIEIVLIGSDSIETVRLTHANYFDGSVAVSKYLAGIQPESIR